MAILRRIDGNPRYLEQVIRFAKENLGFFDAHDDSRPLTERGLEEILSETTGHDIFKVVRRRLLDAPVHIQEALCIASLQGSRFSRGVVEAVAKAQIGRRIKPSLKQAEDPWGWITESTNGNSDCVGEFSEGLFCQVAQSLRPHVSSLGPETTLQETYRDTLKEIMGDEDFAANHDAEEQLVTYNSIADLLESSEEPNDRALAQRALSCAAKVHLSRFSFEGAAAAYERLLLVEQHWTNGLADWGARLQIMDWLIAVYRKLHWPSKQSSAIKRVMWSSIHFIGEEHAQIVAFAGDSKSVQEFYEKWKARNPATPPEAYIAAASWLVRGMLAMCEYARSYENVAPEDGDDSMPFAPLMVKNVDMWGNREDRDPNPIEFAEDFERRAKNLGKLVEVDFAEREHFRLLVDEIAQAHNDESRTDAALDALASPDIS